MQHQSCAHSLCMLRLPVFDTMMSLQHFPDDLDPLPLTPTCVLLNP